MAVNITMDIISSLKQELNDLDGLRTQNPDTGASLSKGANLLPYYSNRIFGAPFQLLESVDMRPSEINDKVGHEYMRNFLLNSPILSIRPGMPLFTGNDDPTSLKAFLKSVGGAVNEGGEFWESALGVAAQSTIFRSTICQQRMYGFRETYNRYIQCVNYSLRGIAHLMKLTTKSDGFQSFPHGAHRSNSSGGTQLVFEDFDYFNWANYRMIVNSYQLKNSDYIKALATNNFAWNSAVTAVGTIGAVGNMIGSGAVSAFEYLKDLFTDDDINGDVAGKNQELLNNIMNTPDVAAGSRANAVGGEAAGGEAVSDADSSDPSGSDSGFNLFESMDNFFNFSDNVIDAQKWIEKYTSADGLNTIQDVVDAKVKAVQFMVDPISFQEGYSNQTQASFIETKLDEIGDIGAEIGWITNSDPSNTLLTQTMNALGGVTDAAMGMINSLMNNSTGGFITGLFNGAFRAIKGQKMIYPDIYRSSNVESSYHFEMTLMSPYGDIYNYYMNIVVPMIHLLCLVAPQMVTSNSISSPFLVQAYIPGMLSVQLGMVRNLTMQKNPDSKLVTKDGFPTSVKVSMDIHEMYNAMAISSAIDPTTYCYNETLNDYMANMAGLIPSNAVINQLTNFSIGNTRHYIESGEILEEGLSNIVSWAERNYGDARNNPR